MADETAVILELLRDKASVRVLPAFYRGLDGLRASVDFLGGRVPAHFTSGTVPVLNDPVWVMVVDGVAYMLGSTVPQPGKGTIVSAAAGDAVVSTVTGDVYAKYDDTLILPIPGDEVKLLWNEGCWVAGISTPAAEVYVPPTSTPTTGRQSITFYPVDADSYQGGIGWRNIGEVWSSASNRGAWFYGSQIKDTIPDSAVIVSAEIYLPNPGYQIGARPFGRHPYLTKPGGSPTIYDTSTLPGTSGWVTIPTGLLDDLKVNGGGFGFDIGGWWTWPFTGASGAVRVVFDA